jgi:hypothetical protein
MAGKRITSRMKVYTTRIGLRDWLVAADSQKEALKAWDVHKNLFASGDARVTNDPACVALAMKTPGVPVAAPGKVLIPETSNVVKLSSFRRPVDREPSKRAALAKAVDRTKIQAAERELAALEKEVTERRADLANRKRALKGEEAELDAEEERRRARLEKRVKREKDAVGES